MRLQLYRFIGLLIIPFLFIATWRRCQNHRRAQSPNNKSVIKNCIKSRFGFNKEIFEKKGIWIHAVSVGETRSIFPLLTELNTHYPKLAITLTNGSIQGAIQSLKFSPVKIQHQMIPFDYPFAVNRFLDNINPKLVIMIETEIWPNLYQACSKRKIPIILINARLKEKSFHSYLKWGGKMIKDTLNQTELIAAQSSIDAAHFIKLGAKPSKVKALGNLKFDMHVSPTLIKESLRWKRNNDLSNRFIWVAASTHGDSKSDISEERLVLKAHKQLLAKVPNALLILIPRHPSRFNEVSQYLSQSPFKWSQRSHNQVITNQTQVYFADTMGELMTWFASCDTAFVGGSLVEFGGHNILEPAALSKPILSGPHYRNLEVLYKLFTREEAIKIVNNTNELGQALIKLATDEITRTEMGNKANQCYQTNSGTLNKVMTEIKPYLKN